MERDIKKIKVLQVVGGMDRAGAETFVMNLFRNINKDKYDFNFLYFTDKKCDYDDEILSLNGKIHRIKLINFFSNIINLIRFFKKERFDVVHSHVLFKNYLFILAAYFSGVKIRIAHSHNTSDKNSNSFIGKLYHSFSKIIIFIFSNKKVACGIQASSFLFPYSKDVFIVNNGIELLKDNSIKIEHKLSNSKTIKLIQVGRIEQVKNIEFSILFCNYLISKGYKVEFDILGQGSLEDQLRQKVRELKLENNVNFLGVQSDVRSYMQQSDILLMPSFHEGFPVVLIEAQSVGLNCLISSNISQEVDLGLGLIYFNNLQSFENWECDLIKIKEKAKVSISECNQTLKMKGFDIEYNMRIIEGIYNG